MLSRLSSKSSSSRMGRFVLFAVLALSLASCGNMRDQAKIKTYDASPNFGNAARTLSEGTVPVGFLREDSVMYRGVTETGELTTEFPMEITQEVLQEGRRQYEAFCAPCHGYGGYGDGVVALEGYPQPAPVSYHIDRLREAPNGYFYQVISDGVGQMFSYAARITPENRWAIVAYIRALQISQNVPLSELPSASQATD